MSAAVSAAVFVANPAPSSPPPGSIDGTPSCCVAEPPRRVTTGACAMSGTATCEGAAQVEARATMPLSVVRLPVPSDAVRPTACVRVEATSEQGERYDGHLLADIFEYRALRARLLDGHEPSGADLDRLATLESRLRPTGPAVRPDGRAARRSLRWLTAPRSGFRLVDPTKPDATDVVAPHDLGAGGVCVATEQTYEAGQALELRVATHDEGATGGDEGPLEIRQAVRVAWAREGRVGLMFAGGPAWSA